MGNCVIYFSFPNYFWKGIFISLCERTFKKLILWSTLFCLKLRNYFPCQVLSKTVFLCEGFNNPSSLLTATCLYYPKFSPILVLESFSNKIFLSVQIFDTPTMISYADGLRLKKINFFRIKRLRWHVHNWCFFQNICIMLNVWTLNF